MTKFQSIPRLLILSSKKTKSSAFIKENKIFIIGGLLLNAMMMNTVIFMFWDMTKNSTNAVGGIGLPEDMKLVLLFSATLQTIFAILISQKIWTLGKYDITNEVPGPPATTH